MNISNQTTYFNDEYEDLWVDVNSDGTVVLNGFDHCDFEVKDLRRLALMLEHVASVHEPSIFDDEGTDDGGEGGEQLSFDFGEEGLPDGVYVIEGTPAEIAELIRRQAM